MQLNKQWPSTRPRRTTYTGHEEPRVSLTFPEIAGVVFLFFIAASMLLLAIYGFAAWTRLLP